MEMGVVLPRLTLVCLLSMALSHVLNMPITAMGGEISKWAESTRYGIVMDAGSSSMKLKVYSWIPQQVESTLPRINLILSKRFEPAINSFASDSDPAGLEKYLAEILATAEDTIPLEQYSDIPVYLLATAGMRYLHQVDTESLLNSVRDVLANDSLHSFRYSPHHVQVLSGEEEGVFAWIALNYLLGFLNSTGSQAESYGVLEMGGGSTQIAFIPRGPLYSEEYKVVLAGDPYHLYVQSYLNFGSNAITQQVAEQLGSNRVPVRNPCMLKGDEKNVTLDNGLTVMHLGMGKPAKCRLLLDKLLKPSKGVACYPKPCAIGRVYQPDVSDIVFYGTLGFTYTPMTLGVLPENNVLNITKLKRATGVLCRKTLDQAVGDGHRHRFASQDCLMGLYISTLLTKSYGFSENTHNIVLASHIGNQSIDWALGAMLVWLPNSVNSENSQSSVTCDTAQSADAGLGYARKDKHSGENVGSLTVMTFYLFPFVFIHSASMFWQELLLIT